MLSLTAKPTRVSVVALAILPALFPPLNGVRAAEVGDTLYNGIVLPSPWPPHLADFPTSVEKEPVVPPYLVSPPNVIPIDIGRRLFVDDFLIAETTLTRTFHLAKYHPASPVLKPDQAWEMKNPDHAAAMVFSDGVWYDPKDQLFKMWYLVGESASTGYATSRDGIRWTKPAVDAQPPTNIVQPCCRDSSTVWLELEEKDPARRFKMFRVIGAGGDDSVSGWNNWVMAIHFSRQTQPSHRKFSAQTAAGIVVSILLLGLSARAAKRAFPQLRPPGERIRLLIGADAACEIDDVYAVALALASQDRFNIEGFVAAHLGDTGGPQGIERSAATIKTVLEKAGMAGRFPVKRGAPPFQYSAVPVEPEGVDFIIDQALAAEEKRPLWIVSLGACTDVSSVTFLAVDDEWYKLPVGRH